MKNNQGREITTSTFIVILFLILLVALPRVASLLPKNQYSARLNLRIEELAGRNSFWLKAGAGYYENLMQQSHDQSKHTTLINFIIDGGKLTNIAQRGDIYSHGGFRIYQGIPNLNFENTVEGPIKTNSYGFFDDEHTLQKADGTRRIAILGDSVTRGWGIEADKRFTHLLSEDLNSNGKKKFEILNFAVSGYRFSQIYDLEIEEASSFNPDVYILALTDLTAGPTWADHIVQLASAGSDLKYDILRQAVAESGLKKEDSPELSQWKLAPYRQMVLRDLLLQMQEQAKQNSAQIIVVLVPAAQDQDFMNLHFRTLREILSGMRIPVIDLSDTFRSVDIDQVRLNWYDPHPNALGHQLIAQNLYNKLRENPEAWAAITGMPEHSSVAKGIN